MAVFMSEAGYFMDWGDVRLIPGSRMHDFAFEIPKAWNLRPYIGVQPSASIDENISLICDDLATFKVFDLESPGTRH